MHSDDADYIWFLQAEVHNDGAQSVLFFNKDHHSLDRITSDTRKRLDQCFVLKSHGTNLFRFSLEQKFSCYAPTQ